MRKKISLMVLAAALLVAVATIAGLLLGRWWPLGWHRP